MLEKKRKIHLNIVTTIKIMIRRSKRKNTSILGFLATLTAISTVNLPAKALDITFRLGGIGDTGPGPLVQRVNGTNLELTLSNPLDESGTYKFDESGNYVIDEPGNSVTFKAGDSTLNPSGGMRFSNADTTGTPPSPSPYSFQLTFNQPVRLVSYHVNDVEEDGIGNFFNLTQNSLTSNNNSVATTGLSSFTNTADIWAANKPIIFESGDLIVTNGAPDNVNFALGRITVSAVPFEFSPSLGLIAVGGIWGISRLRKRLMA